MVATPDDILNWAFPRNFPYVLSPQPNRKLSHQIEFLNHKFHGSLAPIPTHPRIGPSHVNLIYLSIFFFPLWQNIENFTLNFIFGVLQWWSGICSPDPIRYADRRLNRRCCDFGRYNLLVQRSQAERLDPGCSAIVQCGQACVYCGNGRVQETRRWRWWIGEWSDEA